MQKLNICENGIKNSHLAGVQSARRADVINHYWETKEYRLAPYGLRRHIRRSTLTKGAKICFDVLLDESTFSQDWSTQISRECIALEIGLSANHISRLLTELENSGYIKRHHSPSKATTIYINLPECAIKDLEESNDRTRKLKKCGTVASSETVQKPCEDVVNSRAYQKGLVVPIKNDSSTIYNTKINTTTTKLDLAKRIEGDLNKKSVVVVSCKDESPSPKPIASLSTNTKLVELNSKIENLKHLIGLERNTKNPQNLPSLEAELSGLEKQYRELQARQTRESELRPSVGYMTQSDGAAGAGSPCSSIDFESLAHVVSDDKGIQKKINLFIDEDDEEDYKKAACDKNETKAKIAAMRSKLDSLPASNSFSDISEQHKALKTYSKIKTDIEQLEIKLSSLNNSKKFQDSLQLADGQRVMTQKALKDLHVAIVEHLVAKANKDLDKIDREKGRQLLVSAIFEILKGSLCVTSRLTGALMTVEFSTQVAGDKIRNESWIINNIGRRV